MEIKHRNRKEREIQTCFLKTHQTETNAQQSKHLYKIPTQRRIKEEHEITVPQEDKDDFSSERKHEKRAAIAEHWPFLTRLPALTLISSHHTAGQSHTHINSLSLSLLAQHPVCAAPLAATPSLTSHKPAIPRQNTCQGNTTYKNWLLKDH